MTAMTMDGNTIQVNHVLFIFRTHISMLLIESVSHMHIKPRNVQIQIFNLYLFRVMLSCGLDGKKTVQVRGIK